MSNTQFSTIFNQQNPMIIEGIIICKTNGTILSEFRRNKKLKLYTSEQIINQVINQSRKLAISTYDNQILHLCLEGMQIYYKANSGVLFITILPLTYKQGWYLSTLFDMIINEYLEQAKSLFKTTLIPNRLSKLEEAHLKMFEQSLAIICYRANGKSLLRVTSMNDNTHKQEDQMNQQFKKLEQREELLTFYSEINKMNPIAYEFNNNLKEVSFILLCKKLAVIFMYILTIIIGFYILNNT